MKKMVVLILSIAMVFAVPVQGGESKARKLSTPVIGQVTVKDNHVTVSLKTPIKGATDYIFTLGNSKPLFMKAVETKTPKAVFKDIPKGEYQIACRAFAGHIGSGDCSEWSKSRKAAITVNTPEKPEIQKVSVRSSDVRITISLKGKADGFEAALLKQSADYQSYKTLMKTTKNSGSARTIDITGAPKGEYFVAVRSYKLISGRKIFSQWYMRPVSIPKGKVINPPSVKSTKLSKRTLTASVTLPKGVNGADWVLARKCIKNKNGTYTNPSDYAYIVKNQTGTNIVFKNLKPGTYYLAGHAYVKDYSKMLGPWCNAKKIIVK